MFTKTLLCIITFLLASQFVSAQWVKQTVNTTASFRGLSVVNEKVVWASGTDGTVIRTIDGGKTWNVMTIPALKNSTSATSKPSTPTPPTSSALATANRHASINN